MRIKKIIRKVLRIRQNETIRDGLNRKKMKLVKFFDRRKIFLSDFEDLLNKLDILKGDTLIVHCAWRGCYSLVATPKEVIDVLLKKIGDNGTLIMPSYGANLKYFDVDKTPSNAGVLSETFRKMPGVLRSQFPDFAMCGFGLNALDILSNHKFSKYAFDENSPYHIATFKYNAKVLLIGMGKNPYKITSFHLATYSERESTYKNIFTKEMNAEVINNTCSNNVKYIVRKDGISNNNKVFKKIFKKVNKNYVKKAGLNIISFYSKDAYEFARKKCLEGVTLYGKK